MYKDAPSSFTPGICVSLTLMTANNALMEAVDSFAANGILAVVRLHRCDPTCDCTNEVVICESQFPGPWRNATEQYEKFYFEECKKAEAFAYDEVLFKWVFFGHAQTISFLQRKSQKMQQQPVNRIARRYHLLDRRLHGCWHHHHLSGQHG